METLNKFSNMSLKSRQQKKIPFTEKILVLFLLGSSSLQQNSGNNGYKSDAKQEGERLIGENVVH